MIRPKYKISLSKVHGRTVSRLIGSGMAVTTTHDFVSYRQVSLDVNGKPWQWVKSLDLNQINSVNVIRAARQLIADYEKANPEIEAREKIDRKILEFVNMIINYGR